MGLGSSSSKVKEEDPKKYEFLKAIDKAIKSQEGNYILYLFQNNGKNNSNGGSFCIVLYNPIFSDKCFRLLELNDTGGVKDKFRYIMTYPLIQILVYC